MKKVFVDFTDDCKKYSLSLSSCLYFYYFLCYFSPVLMNIISKISAFLKIL